jgi:uncharacterized protein YfaS (alpha-2-macroglobulin family)
MLTAPEAIAEVGIEVSPTHLSPTIAVGDNTTETITLHNLSPEEVTVIAFSRQEGAGARADISLDSERLTLPAGATGAVKVGLRIPSEAQPGQIRAVVDFEIEPAQSSEVAVVGQVEVAFDIQVIRPLAEVEWSWPRFVDSGDTARFWMKGRNTGNFPTRLTGTATIKGLLFGTTELQAESKNLAIGQDGEIELSWPDPPMFGIKRVTLSLSAGAGSPVQKDFLIVILPSRLPLIGLLISLAAVSGTLLIRRFR